VVNSELYRILGTSLGASYGSSFASDRNSYASTCLAVTGGLIGYTAVQMTLKIIDIATRSFLKNQEEVPLLCKRCLMDTKVRLMITANGEPASSMAIVPIETTVDITKNQLRPHDFIRNSLAVNASERSLVIHSPYANRATFGLKRKLSRSSSPERPNMRPLTGARPRGFGSAEMLLRLRKVS